jgi:hypothetical protein
MVNWVGHNLTITGPEAELRRFAACFVKARGERFPRWVEGKFGINEPRPEGEIFFSFERLTPPKPDNWDEWVLTRWGIPWVACHTKIEAKDGVIKVSFDSGYAPAMTVYDELAGLFPKLVIEGDFIELMNQFGGHIRCHAGKLDYEDKSKEIEAEMEAIFKEQDDEFYADLLRYVAGEPNGIRPGTIGEGEALIAKRLVADDPGLVTSERRAELMEKIRTIYDRDHAVHVNLSDEDRALLPIDDSIPI